MQGRILRDILEVPKTTPYMALLLETGMPTMEARLDYKYNNIMNSDESRIVRKILLEQKKHDRRGTWYDNNKENP